MGALARAVFSAKPRHGEDAQQRAALSRPDLARFAEQGSGNLWGFSTRVDFEERNSSGQREALELLDPRILTA